MFSVPEFPIHAIQDLSLFFFFFLCFYYAKYVDNTSFILSDTTGKKGSPSKKPLSKPSNLSIQSPTGAIIKLILRSIKPPTLYYNISNAGYDTSLVISIINKVRKNPRLLFVLHYLYISTTTGVIVGLLN
jgi:hypothetical protein